MQKRILIHILRNEHNKILKKVGQYDGNVNLHSI